MTVHHDGEVCRMEKEKSTYSYMLKGFMYKFSKFYEELILTRTLVRAYNGS